MGGLGPGIGGGEWFIIGLAALLIVGPERLPGLLRQLGKMVAKARGMANEFRASFDEMARQSELDDLRKEVEALRTGQGALGSSANIGAEASAALKDIKSEISKPLFPTPPPAATPAQADTPTATTEWPDGDPVMLPIAESSLVAPRPIVADAAAKPRKRAASSAKSAAKPVAAKAATTTATADKPSAKSLAKPAARKPAAPKATASAKTKAPRRAPVRNTKLDL